MRACTRSSVPARRCHRANCSRSNVTRHRSKTRTRSRSPPADRKSTRLNSSHSQISYAVFCLKKKKKIKKKKKKKKKKIKLNHRIKKNINNYLVKIKVRTHVELYYMINNI